ncbi:MAG: hypothetical protein ACD_54C01178G0001 [uncultured bacterium]|nr:MAG: hypothetical protein ACD_54C01178G0001 [uncultured bacterium]
MAGAHQNRHVVQADRINAAPPALCGLNLLADPARLFLAIPMADQPDLFARLARRPQRLAQAVRVGGNDPGRRRQNMRGRSVILFQPHHMCAGEVLLEPQDIADFRAAPAIDRLVIIANAADVAMRLRQQPQPQILRDVGVLILVHQNVFEPALILFQHVRVLLKDHHAMQ